MTGRVRIPRGVVVLGLVSLCMDLSSEFVHALLPLYLATGLGASMLAIGLIEGTAEAIALVVKVFSGVLSDAVQRRKPLVLAGYGLAALTKPVFALAPTLGWVVAARFADRVGKGIRGAPRDALIADITPPEVRGASFGLRQALDTVGAVLGPIAAVAALAAFGGDFRMAFWLAAVPAFLAVALIVLGVDEPDRRRAEPRAKRRLALADARRLPFAFWLVTAIAALMALARCSEAFLVLRAADVGLPVGQAPWVMVAMTLVYTAAAYPAGAALDRGRGIAMLHGGLAALVAAHAALAWATGAIGVFAGAALWGLHMGLTQGVFAAMVAEHAPGDLRGSAFGVFNLAGGVAMLVASGIAGALWDAAGARAAFALGAALALLTAVALAASQRTLARHQTREIR
ncbi:MAG: MFS transporter [Burkholderiales bacterium]